ncbi:MAG: hypothetical protein Q9159_000191 [Coniocarpon cinnabarinum]
MFEKEMDAAISGLQDQSIDLSRKAAIAVDIKEHVEEWAQDNNHYLGFLSRFVPTCLELLAANPSFISTSPEQKLRNNLLQVLQRFQGNLAEPLGPYVEDIIKRLYSLIPIENEDNAILCIKICMDTLRSHAKRLQGHVQGYLDIVLKILDNIDNIVAESFPANALPSTANTAPTASSQLSSSPRPGSPAVSVTDSSSQLGEARSEQQKAHPLLKSTQSFKVLAECPITVVSIFQAHRDSVPRNVEAFMPRVIKVLETQCPQQEQAHASAVQQKTIHYGVAKDVKNRSAFAEMVNAQVKTMSFLAYILRQYANKMSLFLPKLPGIVVRMLRDCPKERCAVRRELLVAMRHLINFNFRSIFLPVIDDLLDERTLLGDSLTSYEALKPIAYSTLADLLHHVRGQLKVEQIRNTVKVYRSNLLGTVSGTSFQTMSAKLMMNMAECIARLDDKQEARYFFVAILDAAGDKFAAMNRQYANAVKASKDHNPQSPEFTHKDFFMQEDRPPEWDEMDIFAVNAVKINNPRERGTTPIFDNKFLFRTLVNGLKGVFYQLRICNPPNMIDPSVAPVNWSELACGFSAEEVQVLIKLLHEGTKMFQYYETDSNSKDPSKLASDMSSSQQGVPSREEKELLESFATIFHHVDLATFQEIFHSQIPHIYEMMFKHPALVQIPQFLLASEATSPSFAGMLLQFLMGRIEEVGSADEGRSNILLRLFKLSFMAVTLFSQHNEQVLLPHVNTLVTKSIQLSTTAERPENYFHLLRSLFRSIGGGRFEHLYHEILPLLEMLLEVLNTLIAAARTTEDQDLYVELSLTVPARLSNLLPHLSYLMKPLVLALRAGSELVSQGLRTLELCVDNLTADYLDPIMAPVIDDLMAALWSHLKPGPYNHFHSHTTMRILGKLGGRNRKFLEGPPQLHYEDYSDLPPSVDLKLLGTSTVGRFPARLGLKTACAKLREPPSRAINNNTSLTLQKQQALKLIVTHIRLLLGSESFPADLMQQVRSYAQVLNSTNDAGVLKLSTHSSQQLSISKRDSQQQDFHEVLRSLMEAVCIPELAQEASSLLDDVLRHLIILEIAQAVRDLKHDPQSFDVNVSEGALAIDHRVIIPVIVDCLCSNAKEVREVARKSMLQLRDLAITITGNRECVTKLPLFSQLLSQCCHNCYMEEWWSKSGGALGVNTLATAFDMGSAWLATKQIDIARALMYAAKDLPDDLPQATRVEALETLDIIIRKCNSGITREDVLQQAGTIHNLCSFLVLELAHTSQHVRAATQQCFQVLADLSSMQVHELVEPVKATFLTTVFGKPLRALPYPQQIGYIDGVAYFLQLRNGVLQPSDSMTRFLKESSLLAEAAYESMPGRGAPDQRHLEQIIRLKVSCLRFLSLALDFPDFAGSPNDKTRPRVIAIFFRSLYDKHMKVVDAANEALKLVVDRSEKLPKDVLQGGLRPILYSLQDAARLRLENLLCLARLLQILKNYFKVEIGARLLDNVPQIANNETLQRASFHLAEQNEAIKMVKAIFEIFHLLPPAASTFMEGLINRALELEKTLRRTHFSPFREPLVKFLNRYAQDFWDHYHKRVATDRDFGRFVSQIVGDPSSRPLREIIVSKIDSLTAMLSSETSDNEKLVIASNIVQITYSLCTFQDSRKRLLERKEFRQFLMSSGKMMDSRQQSNTVPSAMRLTCEQTTERVTSIFMKYMRDEPNDLDTLFEILSAVALDELKETPEIQSCIYDKIIKERDAQHCKLLFERCLHTLESGTGSEKCKVYLIRYLVNPILAKDVMENWISLSKGTQIVNKHTLGLIQTKLWRPQTLIDTEDNKTPAFTDHFRMEILQMTALLLKYYHPLVSEFRKDLIKFCWHWTKLEDVLNKWAAYAVIAYFAAFYDTPAKIFMPIYVHLIGAHVAEARCLCTQALEIIEPVIPKIHRGDGKLPFWAEAARRAINDDPTNLQLFLSVFSFIGRHPGLFYEAKETFSHMIISSIARVGSLPTTSMDNKKTLLGFLSLLWTWEKRYVAEHLAQKPESPRPAKRKADGTEVNHDDSHHTFLGDSALRMRVIKFLVQFIAYLPDRYPMPSQRNKDISPAYAAHLTQAAEVCRRSLQLFSNFLSPPFWSDLDIGTMFPKQTETNLTAELKQDDKPDQTITRYVNTLQLVNTMVSIKPDEWVRERHALLQKLLEKPLRLRDQDVQDCLFHEDEEDVLGRRSLVQRILQTVPQKPTDDEEGETAEGPRSEFVSFLSTVATEALSGNNVLVGVNILGAFAACMPEEIDQHVPQLMKLLTQHVKEHLNYVQNAQMGMGPSTRAGDGQTSANTEAGAAEATNSLILKLIDVLSARVAQLNDHRRPFLTTLTTLIEKSPNTAICSRIVDLVAKYVLDIDQPFPTLKEKNAVVLKMMTFEHRSDPTLFEKFLDIVIRIYEDPKLTRSELAVRLEPAFLIGTRAQNIEMRNRFMRLFDRHLSRSANKRVLYLICAQNWEPLCETFWLSQAIQLLLGATDGEKHASLAPDDFTLVNVSQAFQSVDVETHNVMIDESYEALMIKHRDFITRAADIRVSQILEPLCYLQHADAHLAKELWVALFPIFWSSLVKEEQSDMKKEMISLLTRDWHARQIDKRPNCPQALVEGIARCESPRIAIPHHLVKFIARTYNAWFTGLTFMESNAIDPLIDTMAVRESNLDALAVLYADLQEDDLFYGLWRRRSQFLTTNTALSYEQIGNWEKAQRTFENATLKARTGESLFSQGEYMLWEDHWVICAQKLQQWEILSDFAKVDNLNDLYLDSIWRQFDRWNTPDQLKQLNAVVKSVADAPTPRRMFFQSFMSLLNLHNNAETQQGFNRICDEATQLSIRKWHQLPKHITNAHIPILQSFQQLVEMHDASVISQSLSQTTANNLEHKAPELKLLLGTWRDRLPNFWDDINTWQDLVTWRRHIFQLINDKYLSLVPQQQNNAGGNSFAFRGFHETAWTINKFAHVARKHQLPEVCITQLSTIYTLPNIEIQEAFLKLREQAKCHYHNPAELQIGLEVINNTNLNYFGNPQKAEFYTLKGMFLARQNQQNEANEAFSNALGFELKLPKAWVEWGRYNEQLFRENPTNINHATSALSCYLEAAGTYKNAKSRKLLSRVLWLLSLDDTEGNMAKTFNNYKGDTPVWYWITFIPQLLVSTSKPEARIVRSILLKLAKHYPQALYYHLRTSRDDFQQIRKQQEAKQQRNQTSRASQSSPATSNQNLPSSRPGTAEGLVSDASQSNGLANETAADKMDVDSQLPAPENQAQDANPQPQALETKPESQDQVQDGEQQEATPKQPWEYIDEITTVLKTGFPLLALSMETMVDQISRQLKASPDEEAYRLIVALFNDALNYISRSPKQLVSGAKLPSQTESNLIRFADSILPAHIRGPFEADFVNKVPDMPDYITKLRKWRDRFEEKLDRRPSSTYLEVAGPHLVEFKFQKFDEVDVPGQYLLHKDKNGDFVRIERFLPDIDLVRVSGICFRKLKIRGHDGSLHSFLIQHPTPRTCRREERMTQMFRFFNDVLNHRKETRRRKLLFTLPVMVPLTPAIRMIEDDRSSITLQSIYEDFCRKKRLIREDPALYAVSRLRELAAQNPTQDAVQSVRLQVFEHIQNTMVPDTLLLQHFQATHRSFDDFWLFRRQTAYQLACHTFMTYVLFVKDRTPARVNFGRSTGNIWGSEMTPSMAPSKPMFANSEAVQVRLTPNLQTLIGPVALEGIFTASVLVIAKALSEPYGNYSPEQSAAGQANGQANGQSNGETKVNGTNQGQQQDKPPQQPQQSRTPHDTKLGPLLSLFVRDEVSFWHTQGHKAGPSREALREYVEQNSQLIVKRAIALAKPAPGQLPANQTVVDLVSKSVMPRNLAMMDGGWMAWL